METLALPLLALVAGVVSFSSPCCLPLLPGYLSYVSALPVSELGDR
ncbi:MAG: cytochrome c biogenesis protein CcdA, partial [Acidimicrobiales bacterium]